MSQRNPRRGIESVYQEQYPGFCGWPKLEKTLRKIEREETRNLFVGTFILGARAMELPSLTKNNVELDYDDLNIMIRSMLVEKQRNKVYLKDEDDNYILNANNSRKFKLVSKKEYRTFPVRNDSPFAEHFINYVESLENDDAVLYPFTRSQISYRLYLIGVHLPQGYSRLGWWYYAREYGEWWPHRIRAERACQLRRELRYDTQDLMEWFGWKTADMPILYGKMEPLDLIRTGDIERRGV